MKKRELLPMIGRSTAKIHADEMKRFLDERLIDESILPHLSDYHYAVFALMKPWFFFRLHRIYDDGEMEIHCQLMDDVGYELENTPEWRDLGGLVDLHGPETCLWEGFVRADDDNEARTIVRKRY